VTDLQEIVPRHKFGVLNIHRLQEILAGKGFDLPHACCVLDVCSPAQAMKVLTEDMGMNVALPCRISVWEENGQTFLGMVQPGAMLAALSDSPILAEVARDVEDILLRILEEAR